MGIARELGLDAKLMTKPYSADEIARVENFAEELANEKITGKLYTLGVPYDNDDRNGELLGALPCRILVVSSCREVSA